MTQIRVGVVGAGNMGRNHLRVYDQLKGAELVGFFDPEPAKQVQFSELYACQAFSDIEAMLDNVDAVSICSPSSLHEEIALKFIQAGVVCLIEKPLATTLYGADHLIEAADSRGMPIAVGHIERFNPAVQQLTTLLEQGAKIHSITTERLSAVSSRIKDVDVVADLMVHDLDIVLSLAGASVTDLYAVESKNTENGSGDHVTALFQFANGVSASLTASRVSAKPARRLTAITDRGVVEIDYSNQSVDVFLAHTTIEHDFSNAPFGEYVSGISLESVQVRRAEPLVLELSQFLAVARGEEVPLVDARQGKRAIEMVTRIQDHLKNGQGND